MMVDKLNPDSILAAEYEYISHAAFQANEDRAKVTTLYLLTVGSFLAAMLTLEVDFVASQTISVALAALFAILSGYAALTLLQLVRLRQAWHESVMAMSQLKEYYMTRFEEEPLKEAFAWSRETVPAQFKPWSISFLLALQVILLGAASLAAAVLFLGLALSGESKAWMWIIAILVALIYFFDLLAVYWWLLREDEKEQ
jgi:hypothetical protein